MSLVPPDQPEWDETAPTAPDLCVDYTEPQVIATLLAVDGTVLLEHTARSPAGY